MPESEVRVSGRTSGGVRGIRLQPDDYVVAMQVVIPDGALVMVGGNGLGKKTRFDEFPRQGRGGMGVRAAVINDKTGPLVAARAIGPDTEEIVAISASGVVIRVPVKDIKFSHRQAQGATLMKVQRGDTLVALAGLGAAGEAGATDVSGEEPPPVSEDGAVLSEEVDGADDDGTVAISEAGEELAEAMPVAGALPDGAVDGRA
jgi:DNA gyrase subunit A